MAAAASVRGVDSIAVIKVCAETILATALGDFKLNDILAVYPFETFKKSKMDGTHHAAVRALYEAHLTEVVLDAAAGARTFTEPTRDLGDREFDPAREKIVPREIKVVNVFGLFKGVSDYDEVIYDPRMPDFIGCARSFYIETLFNELKKQAKDKSTDNQAKILSFAMDAFSHLTTMVVMEVRQKNEEDADRKELFQSLMLASQNGLLNRLSSLKTHCPALEVFQPIFDELNSIDGVLREKPEYIEAQYKRIVREWLDYALNNLYFIQDLYPAIVSYVSFASLKKAFRVLFMLRDSVIDATTTNAQVIGALNELAEKCYTKDSFGRAQDKIISLFENLGLEWDTERAILRFKEGQNIITANESLLRNGACVTLTKKELEYLENISNAEETSSSSVRLDLWARAAAGGGGGSAAPRR